MHLRAISLIVFCNNELARIQAAVESHEIYHL